MILSFNSWIDVKRGFLNQILRSNKTVFSFKDLLLLWGEGVTVKTAKSRISYYVKSGNLIRLRRGFYAKDKNYDRLELATKVFTPSYLSFETVLQSAGIVFQYDRTIFVASYQTKEILCDNQLYSFKQLKDFILTNNDGIEIKENYSIASTERAFLDLLYLNKDYHFDNLSPLNWDKIYALLSLYGGNQRMKKMLKKYYQNKQ